MGQCYLLQDNPVAALEAFRRALRLNPGLEEVRARSRAASSPLRRKERFLNKGSFTETGSYRLTADPIMPPTGAVSDPFLDPPILTSTAC